MSVSRPVDGSRSSDPAAAAVVAVVAAAAGGRRGRASVLRAADCPRREHRSSCSTRSTRWNSPLR